MGQNLNGNMEGFRRASHIIIIHNFIISDNVINIYTQVYYTAEQHTNYMHSYVHACIKVTR